MLILRPPGTRPLPERLTDLGRTARLAAVAAGVFRLAAIVLGVGLTAGLLDAAVHLPPLVRAGFLVTLLTTLGVGWLRLVRPAARSPVTPLAVALRLEDRFPRLNDALASAVSFQQAGSLDRFRQIATLRAENLLDRIDLRRTVPSGRAWVAFWAAVALAGVVLVLVAVAPARTTAAVMRMADPFGRHPWPTRTRIELVEAPTLLALGDPYPVRFRVSGRLPDQATVWVRASGGPAVEEPVAVPDDGEVTRSLDPARVGRDFEVRVTAGDADTGWLAVELAPPPKLVPLNGRPSPQIRLTFPAYAALPPAELPDGGGVVEGVAGTRVALRAAADRDVASAVLRPQFDLQPYRAAAVVAALAADSPLAAVLAAEIAPAFTADIPVRCDGPNLSADFTPLLPGLYALRMTDARGLIGVRLFDLRPAPDLPPVVKLPRPAADRDPLHLLPTARFPLSAAADDRPLAVQDLAVEYQVGGGSVRRFVLAQPEAATDRLLALAGGLVTTIPVRPPSLSADRVVPVAVFTRPDGSPPADGDVIRLRAVAADWDDRTALKEPGRSPEVEIRVQSRESLDAKFQNELAGLRPDLLRLAEELRAARDLLPEQPAAATAALQGARAKLDDPAAGLRERADRLQRTRAANALPGTPTTDKADAAATALQQAAEKLDAATGPAAADNVKAAEAAVRQLLERLEQWGGAGEVRGEARALADQVQRVGEQADRAADPAGRDRAADRLDQAAEQAAGLVGKAGRLAVEKDARAAANRAAAAALEKQAGAGPTPDELRKKAADLRAKADAAAAEADALRKAVQAAGGQAVPDDLRAAADELRQNRPGESAAARRDAADRLDKLANPLAEPSGSPADAARELARRQDELRKKAEAAADAGPELQKLAREQRKLRDDAEALAARLTREQKPEAAAAAKQAAGRMAESAEQLAGGKPPADAQDQAAEKLDEVQKSLDPMTKPEQLGREEQTRLAEKLKALRERQAAAVAEAERILTAAADGWDRPLVASLGDLEERQTGLAAEVRPLADGDLKTLPVFAKLVQQAADAMTLAAKRAGETRDDAGPDAKPSAVTRDRLMTPMRTALRRLDQVLAALGEDKPPAGTKPPTPDAPPEPPMEATDRPNPGVSPLAQLKALRAMQAEVAEQTAAFAEAHPDRDKLTEDERAELAALEAAQKDILDLFAGLAEQFRQAQELP